MDNTPTPNRSTEGGGHRHDVRPRLADIDHSSGGLKCLKPCNKIQKLKNTQLELDGHDVRARLADIEQLFDRLKCFKTL